MKVRNFILFHYITLRVSFFVYLSFYSSSIYTKLLFTLGIKAKFIQLLTFFTSNTLREYGISIVFANEVK
jgi:hypothetical protein